MDSPLVRSPAIYDADQEVGTRNRPGDDHRHGRDDPLLGRHTAELIDSVTSPGGTTSRALHVLHQGGFSAILTDAIDAAFRRTLELGNQLDEKMRADGEAQPKS